MASVWVARLVRKHGFEKLVAIKTILPKYAEDETFQKMFFDEARIASRIDHVNVGHIHDLGEEDNILYLVMEWIDGDALTRLRRSILKAGAPFPVDIALRIIADILAGLHAAHELRDNDGAPLGVVHRDVSPQNILVTIEGIAKLIDFGVAKARDRLVEETNTGFVKGKVQYMAPEQALGKVVDRRADLWAVGAVLYHLVAGKPPFDADNQLAMLHVLTSGRKATALPPRIPTKVAEVIEKALTHDPEKRFQNAIEMKNAIERTNIAATTDQVAECLRHYLGEQAEARRHALSVALHTADTRASSLALAATTSSVSGVRGVPAASTGSDSGTQAPINPIVSASGSQPPAHTEDGSLSARSTQQIGSKDPSSQSNPSAPAARREMPSEPTIDNPPPEVQAQAPRAPHGAASPIAPSVPRMPPPLPSSRPKIAAGSAKPPIPASGPKVASSAVARPPPPPPPPPSDPMPTSQPPAPLPIRQSSPAFPPHIPISAPAPQIPGGSQPGIITAGAPASSPSTPAAPSVRAQSQSELAPTIPLPPLGGEMEEMSAQEQAFDRTELMITPPLNPPPTPAEPATGGESLGLASISSSVAMPKPAKPRRGLLIGAIVVGGVLMLGAIGTTITVTKLNFGHQPAFTPTFSPLPPPVTSNGTTGPSDSATPPPSDPTTPPPTPTTTSTPTTVSTPTPTTPPTSASTPHKPAVTGAPTRPQGATGGGAPSTKKLPPPPAPSGKKAVDDGF